MGIFVHILSSRRTVWHQKSKVCMYVPNADTKAPSGTANAQAAENGTQ